MAAFAPGFVGTPREGAAAEAPGVLLRKAAPICALIALVLGGMTLVGAFLVVLAMGPEDSREWAFGGLAAVVVGVAVAVGAWVQGSGLGSRMTDLQLAVSKLGRGSAEVRVRISGHDEVTAWAAIEATDLVGFAVLGAEFARVARPGLAGFRHGRLRAAGPVRHPAVLGCVFPDCRHRRPDCR